MRKIATVFSIFTIVCIGCKKDSSSSTYYLTFQIGNTKYSFDSLSAQVFGQRDNEFSIFTRTHDTSAVNAGGYNSSSSDTSILGTYNILGTTERTLPYFSFNNNKANDANRGLFYELTSLKFDLIITEKTDKYIAGTFQGVLGGHGLVTISNGKFKILYQ